MCLESVFVVSSGNFVKNFWVLLRLEPKARFELALVGYGPTVLPLHHLGEQERGTSPALRVAAWFREYESNVRFLFQRQAACH